MADDTKFTDLLNMSALGDKLREVREGKRLTLGQAQKQTRIHQAVLKALEDGKCDSILNPTYVKSFLKKYAEYLGLDSRQILNEYRRLCPEPESGIVNRLPGPQGTSKGPSIIAPLIKFVVIVVIAIAMLSIVIGRIAPYFKDRVTVTHPSTAKAKRAAPKEDPGIAISKNVQLKLLLIVNKTVMIKMRTDGVLLFERVLTKGTAEIFTADKNINIYAAEGSSIELVLNGKQMGSPGKGVLKNIEITRTGIKLK